MRHDFFTITDLGYAPRALVLYRSLADVCSDFRLRLFCVDQATKELFDRLALPRLVTVGIGELEAHDPELLAVRPTRTTAEYCWTAKSSACLYTFRLEPDVDMLTYVDSDLMLFHEPSCLFEELGTGSILVVPHRHPARLQWWDRWGIYNAGFVGFRRDEVGLAALRWWRERCLEWCYDRLEDGKSGDQTYLDDWPTRFPGTHVLEHPGGGLAPWNATESVLGRRDGTVTVDGLPLVFYHFASLRLYDDLPLRRLGLLPKAYRFTPGPVPLVWTIDRSYAPVSRQAQELVWDPYLRRLGEALAAFSPGTSPSHLARPDLGELIARATPRPIAKSVHRARSLARRVARPRVAAKSNE